MPSATGVSRPSSRRDRKTCALIWRSGSWCRIIFFSLSHSKLPGYILPAIPAGTILLADFILRREHEQLQAGDVADRCCTRCCRPRMLIAAFVVSFKLLKLALPRTVIIVAASLAIITS